jgi:hypothetical protein
MISIILISLLGLITGCLVSHYRETITNQKSTIENYAELLNTKNQTIDDKTQEIEAFRKVVSTLRFRGDTYRNALDEILNLKGNHIYRSMRAVKLAKTARESTKG